MLMLAGTTTVWRVPELACMSVMNAPVGVLSVGDPYP